MVGHIDDGCSDAVGRRASQRCTNNGADVGGRLGRAEAGDHVAAKVRNGVRWLRERCESVDAAALRAASGDDLEAFRSALHRSRAEALRNR